MSDLKVFECAQIHVYMEYSTAVPQFG